MADHPVGLGETELTEERSEPVPEREVMTLLTGGTASALPGLDGATTAAPTGADGPTAAGSATDSAGAAPQQADDTMGLTGTNADASSSESEPSVSSEDRSETLTASDTAVAET